MLEVTAHVINVIIDYKSECHWLRVANRQGVRPRLVRNGLGRGKKLFVSEPPEFDQFRPFAILIAVQLNPPIAVVLREMEPVFELSSDYSLMVVGGGIY